MRPSATGRGLTPLDSNLTPSTVTIGATARLTFTDNGALSANTTKKSDLISEVSPAILATANRPDARGTASYGLRAINSYNNTIPNTILHDLRGFGDLGLGSDRLRLSARGFATNGIASPFALSSVDTATTPAANRVLYKRFELSPYYLGRIDNVADYQIRYRAGYYDSGVPELKTTENSLIATARSDSDFSRLGWQMSAQGSRRRFDNGFDYGSSALIMTAMLAASPAFRAGLSANYSKVEIVVDSQGRTSGWGPGFLANWTPSERTSLSLIGARQYYGDTGSLRFAHRAPSWSFSMNAQRALVSPIETNILFLDPSQQFGVGEGRPTNNPIADGLILQGLANPAGALFVTGLSTAALTLETGLNASFGILGSTNSAVLTLFSSRRAAVPLTADAQAGLPTALGGTIINSNGGIITYRFALSGTSALIFRGTVSNWRNDSGDAQSQVQSLSGGYYAQLSQNWRGSIELRRSKQRTGGTAVARYDQDAVVAAIDARF